MPSKHQILKSVLKVQVCLFTLFIMYLKLSEVWSFILVFHFAFFDRFASSRSIDDRIIQDGPYVVRAIRGRAVSVFVFCVVSKKRRNIGQQQQLQTITVTMLSTFARSVAGKGVASRLPAVTRSVVRPLAGTAESRTSAVSWLRLPLSSSELSLSTSCVVLQKRTMLVPY